MNIEQTGNIPIGTSVLALCPQTMQLHKNLTTANIRQTFDTTKGPSSIVATNMNKKSDEKCYL